MLDILNFFIGIGIAAVEAIKIPAIEGAKFLTNLGINLLGISSDFIGNGIQGLIGNVVVTLKQHREYKRLKDYFSDILEDIFIEDEGIAGRNSNNIIIQIIDDINEIQKKEQRERKGKSFQGKARRTKRSSEILKNNDVRVLMKMSTDLLFYKNVSEYLMRSDHYRHLKETEEDKANRIALLIDITVNTYAKDAFYKMPGDFKVLAYIITHTLKEHDIKEEISFKEEDYERLSEKLSEKLLYLAAQNGGVINPQAVATAKYAPKYVMRSCPGCGYDGPRILVDEKTNSVHCAACGGTYDVLQYTEPEICTEIDKKVDGLVNNNNEIKVLIAGHDKEIQSQIDELKNRLKEQYKAQLTRDYLDACLKGQTDSFEEKFKEIGNTQEKFIADFRERISKVLGIVESQADGLKKELKANVSDVIETLKTKNEEDRRVNAHLSQMLDSLGNQIASLYEYAQGQFEGLDIKSDRILEYVEKMCSKEYYEEMSNALGTDINKAIVREVEAGYNNIAALSATSISQILAAIDDLKSSNTNANGQVDVSQLEKAIQRENVQLSGQITGLQSLIEINRELINSKMAEHHQESLSLLRIIIKQQDEIKATTLAGAGLKMDRRDFEKIYRGRIPTKYLINRGLPGPFSCPYCGVVEERIMNEEQYCQCSICRNYFFKIHINGEYSNFTGIKVVKIRKDRIVILICSQSKIKSR